MSAEDWVSLLVLSVIWGAAFFFYKVLAPQLAPFSLVFGRMALSTICLFAWLYARGDRLPCSKDAWVAFFVMGALNCVAPYALISWGEHRISSGLASILNASTPVFTVLVAHFATHDERLTANRIVGILLGLGGVIVLVGADALRGLSWTSLAQLGVLVASICYACAGVYGRRIRKLRIGALAASTGQMAAATVLSLPLALAVDKPWIHPPVMDAAGWGSLAGIALLSTVLAYVLYFRVLASAGATNVLLVTLLTPISALLLGGLLLHERVEASSMLGMALIFCGLVAIDGRLLRRVALLR